MAADELENKLETLSDADIESGLAVFMSKLKMAEAGYLHSCVHCGLCADSCHYHRAAPEIENVPAHKLGHIIAALKSKSTIMGRLCPSLFGAKRFDREMVRAWVDSVFGRCSLCGRCSINCTIGIPMPSLFRAARAALAAMDLVPSDLQATVDISLKSGNNMAIEKEEWIETVEWIQEELQAEVEDQSATLPLDKIGAKYLYTVNPREAKFFPLSLQAAAKVFWAAKEDWTMASNAGWDLTNYGLFNCNDEQAGIIFNNLALAMEQLRCEALVIGECGHGYQSARWMGPEWLKKHFPFPVLSSLELMDKYLSQGRINVDPNKNSQPLTLHDPCNLVRHGGILEPQRRILRRISNNFVEMTPTGHENYCCGGGGGQLSMSRYKPRRLSAGSIKANQIAESKAKIVAAPCHNCIDQITELNKDYSLGIQAKTIAELVANAIV
jgi:Fe-S oxidoreductase